MICVVPCYVRLQSTFRADVDRHESEAMNIKNPLVTVGIPTFNRPTSLQRVLNCICQQTYTNLEIIVSDNASPGEETKRVVEDCMAQDGRIRYFCQLSNLGSNSNFQFVLNTASGEFFLWMSDDDWRDKSYIEVLLKELQANDDAVLAFCDIAVLDEQGCRRDDFYSTYLPYLRQFTSDKRAVRLAKYFLQDESFGKANLMYGLMRSCAIKRISLDSMYELYGFYGLDNLLVFALLDKGTLKLVDEMFYGCTVGNVKHYPATQLSGFRRRLQPIINQLVYLTAYVRLSKGLTRIAIAVLFPLKILSFYFRNLGRKFSRLLFAD